MRRRTGRVTMAALGVLALSGALFGIVGARTPAFAQQGKASFDFEDGTQGFTAISFKDGQFSEDATAKLEQLKSKELVKSGDSALSYSYKLENGVIRALAVPTHLPPNARSIRLWARSNTATILAVILREPDDSRYNVNVTLPANVWSPIALNLDEFTLSAGAQDENGKLDLEQVDSLALFDFSWTFLANEKLAKGVPNPAGQRQLLLDDIQLSTESAPLSTGSYKAGANEYQVVDNFESGTLRWMPIRANFNNNPPSLELFPADAPLTIAPEAAAPGTAGTPIEPGGKGLRFSYKRTAGQAYALIFSLADRNLKGVTTLKLNLRVTHKALMIVEVKEKDGSKYQQNLYPDNNTGWRSLSYPLGTLVQADDSNDENDKLDVDQIGEISIADSSPMMAESTPPGDVTIEVDSVVFQIK